MSKVTSRDGTTIAYERLGSGPPVILVDGALCSRAFGPMPKLGPLLARRFTVVMYDRRGRGESGDNRLYAREREVEDIAALVQAAGGRSRLVGLSSGAALALEAAAAGLPVDRVVAYEPPYMTENTRRHADHEPRLRALLAEGRHGEMVKYFMRDMVEVPGIFVILMRLMPHVWRKMKAVAHTLPYDAAVMNHFTVPLQRLASIRTPTLVVYGGKTDERLKKAAAAVAAAVPGSELRSLPGQTHNVNPRVLADAIGDFLAY
jgi:pimeloyl-ACP methyl ester carboxylesterase